MPLKNQCALSLSQSVNLISGSFLVNQLMKSCTQSGTLSQGNYIPVETQFLGCIFY
ncbi:hypothetical protein pb186bvf_000364 [Paramecium bursaria]